MARCLPAIDSSTISSFDALLSSSIGHLVMNSGPCGMRVEKTLPQSHHSPESPVVLTHTVKTVPPFPLRGRLYSFSWGKYYLFEMEKPSFPTSSILIWESSPFLRWRGPFSQLGEHRPLFNGMSDIFSRMNTVLLTIDLNRKEFHYQKSYQLL